MITKEDLREAYADGYDHGKEEGYQEGYADGLQPEIVEVLTKGKLTQTWRRAWGG